MKKIAIVILILVMVLGAGAFSLFTRPAAQPSQNIQTSSTPDQLATSTDSTNSPQAEKLYRISQADSNVEFKIRETLYGNPFTAIGTTNQVAGDVIIKTGTDGRPTVQLGTIQIDARALKTDSRERDGAIKRFILKTDNPANEYIVFTPTSVNGLPSAIKDGKEFTATVAGNLTISGVTKPATFNIVATRNGSILSATATAALKRSDYGLIIPNIPFVANVSDSFSVDGTFTANLVQ